MDIMDFMDTMDTPCHAPGAAQARQPFSASDTARISSATLTSPSASASTPMHLASVVAPSAWLIAVISSSKVTRPSKLQSPRQPIAVKGFLRPAQRSSW